MSERDLGALSTRAPSSTGGVAGRWARWTAVGPDGLRRGLGRVLVLAWVTWVVLALLALPRPVSAGQLERDLADGRVASWHVVLVDPADNSIISWVDRRSPLPIAPEVVASEGEGRSVGYLVEDALGRYRIIEPASGPDDVLVQRMRDADVPLAQPVWNEYGTVVPADAERWGAVLLGLAGVLLVVGGPRPSRGTRWFWVWLLGLPVGIGVLAYVVLELLRPLPPRVPWVVPQHRMSGLRGFLLLLLGGLLLAGGLHQLGAWFGPGWTLPR